MKESINQKVIHEIIYGGHILSIGATCTVVTVIFLTKLPVQWPIIFIPYLSSQIIYTYNHWRESAQDSLSNPDRAKFNNRQRSVISLSLYLLAILIILLFTNWSIRWLVLLITLAGILYTDYVKKLTTQKFPAFKNIYTSFFWAVAIYLIPIYYSKPISALYTYLFLFVLFRFLISTAFFDIKDLQEDAKQGLKTLPVLVGRQNTLIILHIANFLSVLPLVIGYFFKVIPDYGLLLCISVAYDFYYLLLTPNISPQKLRTLSYTVVDGETILWLAITGLSKYLLLIKWI